MPLVGPGVEDCSRESPANHGIEMPFHHLRLLLLGVAYGIHPELAHDQGLVFGKILEARKVAFKVLAPVEVDIECQEINVLGKQVFRGGITGVGVQGAGVFTARNVDQMLHKLRDTFGAQPPDHGGGDLVAEQVSEDGMVSLVFTDSLDHGFFHRSTHLGIVQKLHMLHPGDAEEYPQAIFKAQVKKPPGWCGVDPDKVCPGFPDCRQILCGLFGVAELMTQIIGCKGTVGHPFDKEFLFPFKEEL